MKAKTESSFYDLKKAAQTLGYKSFGLASPFETLFHLPIPVIVLLNTRQSSHFSVLMKIKDNSVHLADPSYGNIRLTEHQFKRRWLKKNEGRFLVILKPFR